MGNLWDAKDRRVEGWWSLTLEDATQITDPLLIDLLKKYTLSGNRRIEFYRCRDTRASMVPRESDHCQTSSNIAYLSRTHSIQRKVLLNVAEKKND
jgi:hypothetical protein